MKELPRLQPMFLTIGVAQNYKSCQVLQALRRNCGYPHTKILGSVLELRHLKMAELIVPVIDADGRGSLSCKWVSMSKMAEVLPSWAREASTGRCVLIGQECRHVKCLLLTAQEILNEFTSQEQVPARDGNGGRRQFHRPPAHHRKKKITNDASRHSRL